MQRNSLTRTCLLLWAAALTSVLVTCMSPSAVGVAHRQKLSPPRRHTRPVTHCPLSPSESSCTLHTRERDRGWGHGDARPLMSARAVNSLLFLSLTRLRCWLGVKHYSPLTSRALHAPPITHTPTSSPPRCTILPDKHLHVYTNSVQ